MNLLRRLLLTLLLLAPAGVASAVPVDFRLDSVTITGGTLPVKQIFFPGLPSGGGDIDFANGTGSLNLSNHFIIIDLNLDGNDARLLVAGWQQTITAIDASGNLTSIGGGTVTCTDLGGLGSLVCGATPTTVGGWPPAGATSSAVLDQVARTILVIDNSNAAAGTATSLYSYDVVPEPGTATLAGLGLAGLAWIRRRQRG